MADTQHGVYVVGELLGRVPREYQTRSGEKRTAYEVKVLVGTSSITVNYTDEAGASSALGGAKDRATVTLRVVVLIQNGRNGAFLKYVGLGRPGAGV